jgi:hypothetical protein
MRVHLHQHLRIASFCQSSSTHSNFFVAMLYRYKGLRQTSRLLAWESRTTFPRVQHTGQCPHYKICGCPLFPYRASSSNKKISNAVLTLSRLQKSIQRYEHEILQLVGVGSEWSEVHQLSNRVCEVTCWTEEVLCLATVDSKGFIVSHATKQLMFQVVETCP